MRNDKLKITVCCNICGAIEFFRGPYFVGSERCSDPLVGLRWLQVTETGVEVLTARLPTSPDVFPWLR
jgi:hypothetical protein